MTELQTHLGSARHWYIARLTGIEALRLAGREEEAQGMVEAARAALEASGLSADEQQAVRYELRMDEYLVINYNHPESAQAGAIRQAYAAISALQPLGPLSDRSQAFNQLSLIGMGTRRKVLNPSEAEVDALLERVPEACRTNVLWYYISSWAFLNGHLKYIELSYIEQLTRTSGISDSFYWLRTNLMYLLMSGRATRRDILETIRGYERLIDMADFDNFFKQPLKEAGLYGQDIEAALDERCRELQAAGTDSPRQQSRTKQISR